MDRCSAPQAFLPGDFLSSPFRAIRLSVRCSFEVGKAVEATSPVHASQAVCLTRSIAHVRCGCVHWTYSGKRRQASATRPTPRSLLLLRRTTAPNHNPAQYQSSCPSDVDTDSDRGSVTLQWSHRPSAPISVDGWPRASHEARSHKNATRNQLKRKVKWTKVLIWDARRRLLAGHVCLKSRMAGVHFPRTGS
ncbi:hypothetical protein U1Q18_044789 [Sarracenia purpurea var. burkii]